MRLGLLLPLLLAVAPAAASAHPVDEVVQGAYLTVVPGAVKLELELTPGVDVADQVLRFLDVDGDRTISEAERRDFGRRVLAQSKLTIDGQPAAWTLLTVETPPYETVRLGGAIRIYAQAPRTDRAGRLAIAFDNRYTPVASRCFANIFLQPAMGWRYQVLGQQHGQDGRAFTAQVSVAR